MYFTIYLLVNHWCMVYFCICPKVSQKHRQKKKNIYRYLSIFSITTDKLCVTAQGVVNRRGLIQFYRLHTVFWEMVEQWHSPHGVIYSKGGRGTTHVLLAHSTVNLCFGKCRMTFKGQDFIVFWNAFWSCYIFLYWYYTFILSDDRPVWLSVTSLQQLLLLRISVDSSPLKVSPVKKYQYHYCNAA